MYKKYYRTYKVVVLFNLYDVLVTVAIVGFYGSSLRGMQ